jgi:glycerol-3-phosphate dehydrogenase
VLQDAQTEAQLGVQFGGGLTEAEVRYLQAEEFVETAEDVLWRRSRLGLHMDAAQQQALSDWFTAQAPD